MVITDELLRELLEMARALPDPWTFHEVLEILADRESDEFDQLNLLNKQ